MRRDKLPPDTTYPPHEEPSSPWYDRLDGDTEHRQEVFGVLNGKLKLMETHRGVDVYVISRRSDNVQITHSFTNVLGAMRGIKAVQAKRALPSRFYPIYVDDYRQEVIEFVCSLAGGGTYFIRRAYDAEFVMWEDQIGTRATETPRHEPAVQRVIAEWRSRQPKRPAPPRPRRPRRHPYRVHAVRSGSREGTLPAAALGGGVHGSVLFSATSVTGRPHRAVFDAKIARKRVIFGWLGSGIGSI